MKAVYKDINFAGEKADSYLKILYFLPSNIVSQSLILMNL